MNMQQFDEMAEVTGVFNGDKFHNAQEVHDYLTTENMTAMFGCPGESFERYSQHQLDRFAEQIIDLRAHCAFDEDVKSLTCCCCGGRTRGRQHSNRDTGYGLCSDCARTVRRG